MRNFRILGFVALLLPALLAAQGDDKDYKMVDLLYIKVNQGQQLQFEAAVKEHNEKYHNKAPYGSQMMQVVTGNEFGWYLWIMGTLTYSDLDGAPGEGEHMDHWREKVEPFIAEYGRREFWRLSDDLSAVREGSNPLEVLWFLDLKRGEYYRFRAFMEKVKAIHEQQEDEMAVWFKQFNENDGRDVVIIWPLESWASLDEDDWKMKEEYDKEYGEGSWENALKEWDGFVESSTRCVLRNL